MLFAIILRLLGKITERRVQALGSLAPEPPQPAPRVSAPSLLPALSPVCLPAAVRAQLILFTYEGSGTPAGPTAARVRSPGLTSQPAAEFQTAELGVRSASPPCRSLQIDGCWA
uniref:Serine palmitoyltransferase small subunit B isoform X1 n=1 Tax=Camelus bactrianus TaxID=9837 RepID=A0A9W3HG26_CAMBA|nr:serine palmitoyltransferase small subunit B isoform X1 [Camelus bactrianus]